MAKDKIRIDVLLVEQGLVESRELARRMVMAGEVSANQQVITKPGTRLPADTKLELKSKPRFVSRGGEKLAAALEQFSIPLAGLVCADIGASTGGFTDCMLQNGAEKVYAIDVGYGQLAWPLRQDDRVIVMERTNARYLESLPEPISFASVDVSFISLKHILPALNRFLDGDGHAVTLVKPQFEAGKGEVGKGGVVREAATHHEVLYSVVQEGMKDGFSIRGLLPSPLHGPAGNIEFLMWLGKKGESAPNLDDLIDAVVGEAHAQPPREGEDN